MKATLTFTLPDEDFSFKCATKGRSMYASLIFIQQMMQEHKESPETVTIEQLDAAINEEANKHFYDEQ
jgi:hypothetical protein